LAAGHFSSIRGSTSFPGTLAGACGKTQWQVHAYCLMSNHFHFVVETPHPNLVTGMKWLLGTYTMRFNRRHHYSGHLFGGRYKAQVIDETSPGYLRTAADYVHLNPARAGLVAEGEKLASYPWSSFPAYLATAGKRPAWLRVDRVLGEHGIEQDAGAGGASLSDAWRANAKLRFFTVYCGSRKAAECSTAVKKESGITRFARPSALIPFLS
jgi:REP element-mobilizing transposase RayT